MCQLVSELTVVENGRMVQSCPLAINCGLGTGGPSLIFENKDALLTCVVSENSGNNTVIWKKGDEILTAGTVRVTKDHRVRVLHDESEYKWTEMGHNR